MHTKGDILGDFIPEYSPKSVLAPTGKREVVACGRIKLHPLPIFNTESNTFHSKDFRTEK